MNRKDLLEGYTVKDGRITSPGKFEGEPVYALALYDWYLNGGGETISGWGVYGVTDADRKEWPEIPADAVYLAQSEDDQGFIHTETWTEAEYQKAQDADLDYEDDDEEEGSCYDDDEIRGY